MPGTTSSEREIKLIVPADFELPALDTDSTGVASVVEADPQDLTASYFDTSDLRLLSYGITIRRRTGEAPEAVWTLKLPVNGDPTLRAEISETSEGAEPPGEIATLLRSVLIDDSLSPVAELKTRRRRWRLLDTEGSEVAELVDDRVSVLEGNQIKDNFREIEVEARTADTGSLKKIAKAIAKAGGKMEQRSKASRALDAIRNGTGPNIETAAPGDPVANAVRAALSKLLRNMLARAPHAILAEPEGVHRMRVGQRRLRSILRAFEPLIDNEKTSPFVDELRWLGTVLGDVRDLDVFETGLRAKVGDDPALEGVFAVITSRSAAAHEQLREALASDRYLNLVRTGWLLINDDSLTTATGTCQEEMPALAAKAAEKLRKTARKLTPDSPELDFHEVRKLAKRARYTAETVSEFVKTKDSKALKDFASHMTSVQNVFGEHQDATLARDTLTTIAGEHTGDGPLSFQIGRLAERADVRAAELRKRCLDKWDKLDKDKSTKWPRM